MSAEQIQYLRETSGWPRRHCPEPGDPDFGKVVTYPTFDEWLSAKGEARKNTISDGVPGSNPGI